MIRLRCVISLVLSVVATFALKAEVGDSVGVDLPEFTLTAPASQSLIQGQELSGAELRRMSTLNVADAVRFLSGLQLKDYGGVGGVKTLDIRSLGSNHLGVFYDGVALGNAQNGQIDLGRYSLDNVEAISFYTGQKSDIFTTARDLGSAGSLYIRTRRPVFADSKRYNLMLRMRGGSFGLLNPSINLDYKISRNLSATLSAEYTYATGKYRFHLRGYYPDGSVAWDTTATRVNGDVKALRTELTFFGRYSGGDYTAKVYYYDSERGIPGAIVNNVFKNSQRQWDRNLFVQGNWKGYVSQRVSLMANAKYARDYMHYLNPDTTQRYIDNKFYQDELYASMAVKADLTRRWIINAAADYLYNNLASTLTNFVYPHRHTLMFALASRLDLGIVRVQGNVLLNNVNDYTSIPEGIQVDGERRRHSSRTAFSGGLYADCKPINNNNLHVRAYLKRSFRLPTFNDLYYTDIGNESLNPEYVTQWGLGATERLDFESTAWQYVEVRGECYLNNVKDKIIAVPKGNSQYRWMMMNIGKVRIYGAEVNASAALNPFTDFTAGARVAYTFQRAMDLSNPKDNLDEYATYKGQIAYVPRHSASANIFVDWKGFELNYSYMYVGERWRSSSNYAGNRVAPWWTHDATLAYTRNVRATTLRLQLEVNNLFDRQYEIILNYPMPGRNWRLSLTATF